MKKDPTDAKFVRSNLLAYFDQLQKCQSVFLMCMCIIICIASTKYCAILLMLLTQNIGSYRYPFHKI